MTMVLAIVLAAIVIPFGIYWNFFGGRTRQLKRERLFFQRRAKNKSGSDG